VKNEEQLRHVGNTYDLVYSKAHPPKVRAIPPAEIGGTPLLSDDLPRRKDQSADRLELHTTH